MTLVKGKYNNAKVFTDNAEQATLEQIEGLLDHEFISDSQIRVMPDAHVGAGCTIGTTMTITDKVVPNLVGVDIGCGMETLILNDTDINLKTLDKVIHSVIPAGFEVRQKPHDFNSQVDIDSLQCAKHVNLNRGRLSVGTLGGGNHFIELGKDEHGIYHLVIHSGSRNLGLQVAQYYQRRAAKELNKSRPGHDIPRSLAYLEGQSFDDYLHDMAIMQNFAEINRQAMAKDIIRKMRFDVKDSFTTIHNYIDLDIMILRKGAISSQKDERMLIPINMRDGSLICIGKGNPDWNYSAPHGAGRIMSRREAKQKLSLDKFKKSMEGIYSTTISNRTLDEAPSAYKPVSEIIDNIKDTAEIISTITPVYNFKSA